MLSTSHTALSLPKSSSEQEATLVLELQVLCQTSGWVGASGSHLQEVHTLLPEVYSRVELSVKLGPGSGDCRDSSFEVPRIVSTIHWASRYRGTGL